jgi:hypothetical protein
MNQRGNVNDVFIILFIAFGIGVFSVIMLLLVSSFKDALLADDSIPIEARNIVESGESQLPGIFDWFFAIMFIGLPLISAIFAYFNNIHPLFFWASLLLVILMVFAGAAYQELWGALRDDADLSTQMDRLPITNLVLTNYGFYSFLVFLIIAAGTFIKLRGNTPGGLPP